MKITATRDPQPPKPPKVIRIELEEQEAHNLMMQAGMTPYTVEMSSLYEGLKKELAW